MANILTRQSKTTPLTSQEMDGNFTNLNNDKVEKSANLLDVQDKAEAIANLGAHRADRISEGQLSTARGGTGADLGGADRINGVVYKNTNARLDVTSAGGDGQIFVSRGQWNGPEWVDPAVLGVGINYTATSPIALDGNSRYFVQGWSGAPTGLVSKNAAGSLSILQNGALGTILKYGSNGPEWVNAGDITSESANYGDFIASGTPYLSVIIFDDGEHRILRNQATDAYITEGTITSGKTSTGSFTLQFTPKAQIVVGDKIKVVNGIPGVVVSFTTSGILTINTPYTISVATKRTDNSPVDAPFILSITFI
jgi:hypothetical protein